MELYIKGVGILSAVGSNVDEDFLQQKETPANFLCKEPDYTVYIPPMQLRRMSKAVRMGIGASKIALQQAKIEKPDAISIGTAMGCLNDTEVFLKKMVEQEEQMLTPTAFIQSTHNTVGGQIALLYGCNGHNLTYVHRGHSFEQAMLNAYLYLQQHPDENVLVGGIDELTPTSEAILERFGVLNNGEGANFFVVSNKTDDGICVKDIHCFTTYDTDEILKQVTEFVKRNDVEIDLVIMDGEDEAYGKLERRLFANTEQENFKNLCGEYGTAAAFGLGMIIEKMKNEDLKNVVIVNNWGDSWGLWWVTKP